MSLRKLESGGGGGGKDFQARDPKHSVVAQGGQKLAVVVSGLGDKRPNQIIRDLEDSGYRVEYYTWHELRALPPAKNVDLAVGHSAGATRVELEYGNTNTQVVSLSSPSRLTASNIKHSSNVFDPIGMIGRIINPMQFGGDFAELSLNPHDKNDAWDNIKEEVLV